MELRSRIPALKESSPRLVLGHIMSAATISRADIARETGLHRSTITRIVASLMEEGLVVESGEGDNGVGRKPVMLSVVSESVHVVGIAIESTSAVGAVVNLSGQIVCQTEAPIEDPNGEAVMKVIYFVIDSLLNQAKDRGITVLGIGVAMHGIVNSDQGLSVFAPAIRWRNDPVASSIEERYGLPVRMDNNANAMVLGESWYGNGKDVDNILAVKVGQSIGSGIMLGGQLFPGTDYSAGEIGHLTVLPGGPLCKCGNYGCLETVASVGAVLSRGRELQRRGEAESLLAFSGENSELLSFEHLCHATYARESTALRLWEEVAGHLGLAISYTINILNPAKVLIGGDIFPVLDYVLPKIRQVVAVQVIEPLKIGLKLEPVGLGEESVTVGAATLVLQEIIELPKSQGGASK